MLLKDIENKLYLWLIAVHLLKDMAVARYVGSNATLNMHVFVDACKNAYATCFFAQNLDFLGVKLTRSSFEKFKHTKIGSNVVLHGSQVIFFHL